MTAIPLTAGAYTAASLIADAQRCVNMYPEANPEKTKPNMPVTHYVRPGLLVLSAPIVIVSGPAPAPPAPTVLADETNSIILESEGGAQLTTP
jgi:hypothetical protein